MGYVFIDERYNFSCSFFGVVCFGCWSTRPTTAPGIAYDFKDALAKVTGNKNICNYMKNLPTTAKIFKNILIHYLLPIIQEYCEC